MAAPRLRKSWTQAALAEKSLRELRAIAAKDQINVEGMTKAAIIKTILARLKVPAPAEFQWAAKRQRLKALLKVTPKLDRALTRDHKDPAAAALIITQRLGLLSTDLCAGIVRVTPKGVYFGSVSNGDHQLFSDDALVLKTVKFHMQGKSWQHSLFGTSRDEAAAYLRRHAGPGFKLKDLRIAWATGYAKTLVDRNSAPATSVEGEAPGRSTERIDVEAIRTALKDLLDADEHNYDLTIGADGLAVVEPEPDDPEDAW